MAKYLIIGSGRTAKHFAYYFQLLNFHFQSWSRHQSLDLLKIHLEEASHVLLLISDSALQSFYQENLQPAGKTVLHFSGALEIPGMISAHPLMTFSEHFYDRQTYESIPFVTTSTSNLKEILPGLPNLAFQISAGQKAYYHSLCVISGNFTTILWQKMAQGLEQIGVPESAAHAYRKQIFSNLETHLETALTGPFARKDLMTVRKNLEALKSDSFFKIYQAFAEVFFPSPAVKLETVSTSQTTSSETRNQL